MELLILTSRFPYPLEKGDKLRIYNQIKTLSANHRITLIALTFSKVSTKQVEALSPYCEKQFIFKISLFQQFINIIRAIFSNKPIQVGLFYSPVIAKRITSILNSKKFDSIYCHLIRMADYVIDFNHPNKTIDYMDVFSKGMERRAEKSHGIKKIIFNMEFKRLLDYENRIFNYFKNHTIISEQDKNLIPHADKSKIQIIENGVDRTIFHSLGGKKKFDLLFTGNMGYPPNIEAAIYAANHILPLVHKINPEVTLLIAGINPSQRIKKLASDKIFIIDKFENIRDAFDMCRINLAPMLISIGLQNKILQAMAMRIPTICSTLANNAVNAKDNEEIYVEDSPEGYATKINILLTDNQAYNQMVENGYKFVINRFDWERQNSNLEKLLTPSPELRTN